MKKAFYAQFLRPGSLAFDIGANAGNRTEVFLALGATVVAVEPQPHCAEKLRRQFDSNPHFHLVEKAVGSAEGKAEMLQSSTDTISTMNRDWIERMKRSGRLAKRRWDTRLEVTVTTLDRLVAEYGLPAFIKIDTEGYEQEVLAGLSRPVPALSFEFHPETHDMTEWCIRRLVQLGPYEFNLSYGESMKLALRQWLSADEMLAHLQRAMKPDDQGDIYARLTPRTSAAPPGSP